jgi:catechol 2,3-dioxygenase-like lactoylglutathione lyase family enzyme
MTSADIERQPERGAAAHPGQSYDVGGVRLPRPFKIRRLGHFGYNCADLAGMLDFYIGGLGLIVSDESGRFAARLPEDVRSGLAPGERRLYFTRFGSDHHQLVFMSRKLWEAAAQPPASTNQITWQVGSLAEVVDGSAWIWGRGERLMRSGRDMPGSNWHTYLFDPEGHINELFYGMEQIGWDGLSKPRDMWSGVQHERPELPQASESNEIEAARQAGVDLNAGHRAATAGADGGAGTAGTPAYTVDGIVMARPFKVTGIGPVSLFVDDLDRTRSFYTDVLGFGVRERVRWGEHQGVLLYSGTDHHTLALYTAGLRSALGMPGRLDSMALGLRLANYRQLREAVAFMTDRGAEEVSVPAELVPGFDYVAHLRDPDGNLVQLYYYQRQCAPAGPGPRTVSAPAREWPELIDAPEDVYGGQQFLGPWQ